MGKAVKRSLDEKVKIQMVDKKQYVPKMNTVAGVIYIAEKDATAEIALRGAHQMVDGKNWKYADPTMAISESEYKKLVAEELEALNLPAEELNVDGNETSDIIGNLDEISDDDTKELIKKLPTMKYSELLESAEQAIVDFNADAFKKNTKANKKNLIKLILKTLKGK